MARLVCVLVALGGLAGASAKECKHIHTLCECAQQNFCHWCGSGSNPCHALFSVYGCWVGQTCKAAQCKTEQDCARPCQTSGECIGGFCNNQDALPDGLSCDPQHSSLRDGTCRSGECVGLPRCPTAPNGTTCNGEHCQDDGQCACGSQWTGLDCATPRCAHDCHGRGECVVDDDQHVCLCDRGWDGPTCAVEVPFCQDTKVLSSEAASFSDGSGLLPYRPGSHCTWVASPRVGFQAIQVTVANVTLHSAEDVVEVRDGSSPTDPLLTVLQGPFPRDAVVTSTQGSAVSIVLRSSTRRPARAGAGFDVAYQSLVAPPAVLTQHTTACPPDAVLRGDHGQVLISGTAPEPSHCDVVIEPATPHRQVRVVLSDLSVEPATALRVEVLQHTSGVQRLLGLLSDATPSVDVSSPLGVVVRTIPPKTLPVVWTASDNSQTRTQTLVIPQFSFRVRWEAFELQAACGEQQLVAGLSGSFTSGVMPPNAKSCAWLIVPPQNLAEVPLASSRLVVQVTTTPSTAGVVKVHDGLATQTAAVVRSVSAGAAPTVARASQAEGVLVVWERVEANEEGAGFSVVWFVDTNPESEPTSKDAPLPAPVAASPSSSRCAPVTVLSGTHGRFTDGSLAHQPYFPDLHCEWHIHALDPGTPLPRYHPYRATAVWLAFTRFETETALDVVTLYDGESPQTGRLIGRYLSGTGRSVDGSGAQVAVGGHAQFVSSQPWMALEFVTDKSTELRGWEAEWRAVHGAEQCARMSVTHDSQGSFEGRISSFATSLDVPCDWVIVPDERGLRLVLTVDMDLHGVAHAQIWEPTDSVECGGELRLLHRLDHANATRQRIVLNGACAVVRLRASVSSLGNALAPSLHVHYRLVMDPHEESVGDEQAASAQAVSWAVGSAACLAVLVGLVGVVARRRWGVRLVGGGVVVVPRVEEGQSLRAAAHDGV